MIIKLIFTFVLLAFPAYNLAQDSSPSVASPSASLTVTLTGIRNTRGQIFILIWRTGEGFPLQSEKAYRVAAIDSTKAFNGSISTAFMNLVPGIYAISSLHDENRNGKMDSNVVGVPSEGWAVSNNVVTHLHAPRFEQASFAVSAPGQTLAIALHY